MERIGVAPGTEVGGYRVLGPVGQGGMGAVYRAVDGEGALVALKLLHPHLGADPDARERLRREVSHLQRVRHPGVARVLDAEIDSTDAFVVTELLDGEDLAAHVRTHGPLTPDALADLAEELRDALAVVHRAGVLHRDLTPGNVLMTSRGSVLIDFGIAQAADEARVTSTGLVAGTPGYLSPELLEGGEPTEAADWWGWAALLAFAATGRPPFGVRPLQAVLARARSGDADLDGLDPRTTAALRSALTVEPSQRTAPDQVVHELERAAAGDTSAATVVQPSGPVAATEVMATSGTRVMPTGWDDDLDDPDGGAAGAWSDATVVQPAGLRYSDADLPSERHGHVGDGTDAYGAGPYDADAYDTAPDDADADDTYDAADEDYLDGEPEADQPPDPRRRMGSVLVLGAVAVAAGAVRPGVTLAVVAVLAVLVRSVGAAVDAALAHKARRGAVRVAVARGLVTWPWYLVRAVLGVLPAALVSASVVVLVGGIGWWLLDTGRLVMAAPGPGQAAGELGGNAPWVTPALLAVAVVCGLLVLWFGPMSRATRRGARWTLAAVARPTAGAVGLVLIGLAATVGLTVLVLLGHSPVWWPLPGPPDLR